MGVLEAKLIVLEDQVGQMDSPEDFQVRPNRLFKGILVKNRSPSMFLLRNFMDIVF